MTNMTFDLTILTISGYFDFLLTITPGDIPFFCQASELHVHLYLMPLTLGYCLAVSASLYLGQKLSHKTASDGYRKVAGMG